MFVTNDQKLALLGPKMDLFSSIAVLFSNFYSSIFRVRLACGFVPRHDRAARNRAVPFRARSDVRHDAVPFRALLGKIIKKFFHNFMHLYDLF